MFNRLEVDLNLDQLKEEGRLKRKSRKKRNKRKKKKEKVQTRLMKDNEQEDPLFVRRPMVPRKAKEGKPSIVTSRR